MMNKPSETVRLRFLIAMSHQLSALLMDGNSRREFQRRMNKLLHAFNLAMYDRVLRGRATGFLAPEVRFNADFGSGIMRLHVVVNPLNDSHVSMDFALAATSGANRFPLN
jgi:hypothetical protein